MSFSSQAAPDPAAREAEPEAEATRRRVYLHPSRMFVSSEPHVVVTILGSCVAVCLWDRRRGLGGINHYLLPFPTAPDDQSGRFGTASNRLLVERMRSLGSRIEDLEARVFGGACMMSMFRGTQADLGSRNARLAFEMLERAGIRVVAEHVGGKRGRRLSFQTDDGQTHVRLL